MIQKEFREFFLRNVAVNAGTKKDQQANYPTRVQVVDCSGNITKEYNRFLKDHFPSEDVFKKLFESLTFKLNPEDVATTDATGLVRIAIGSNIVGRLDEETITGFGDYTTVVVPSTLPVVSNIDGSITVTPQIRRVSDNAIVGSIPVGDRNLYYVDYQLVANFPTPPTPPDQIDNIQALSNVYLKIANTTVDNDDINLYRLLDAPIPANTLQIDGDELQIDWFINHTWGTGNNVGTLELSLGTDAVTSNNERVDIWQDPINYQADRTFRLKISIKRQTNVDALVTVELYMYFGTGSNGTTNIGTNVYASSAYLNTVGMQAEERQIKQYYIKSSSVIDWDAVMNVRCMLRRTFENPSSLVDYHTIHIKAEVD
jgi:hypothetical protein